MNDYLNKHKIYALLQNSMEDLLLNQPEDPLEHMEKYFSEEVVTSVNRPHVVLVSPPGCDQQEYSQKLAAEYNLVNIDVSYIVKSSSNEEIQKYVKVSEHVPDKLLYPLIEQKIQEALEQHKGWVINGFPRTDLQACYLINKQLTHIIELKASKEFVVSSKPHFAKQYDLFCSTLDGIRHVFKSISTIIELDNISKEVVFEEIKKIVSNRNLVIDKKTREILPAGPGLVSSDDELKDLNFARVTNTKPKIEEIE